MAAPKVKFYNGMEMPAIGMGTMGLTNSHGVNSIKDAIDVGYRHFDTAFAYTNEKEVGQAIRDKIAEGIIKREDVFVTTKMWNNFHEPHRVEYACRKSVENLDIGYIDLYLMHLPVGYAYESDDQQWPRKADGSRATTDVDYLDTWKVMEECVRLGMCRSIGVSNFNSQQIERLLQNCTIKPVVNQVECNILINQKRLIKFCKDREILITGFCPLGHLFDFDSRLKVIAAKYNKSSAQLILRYLVELGCIPIPRSTNKGRLLQNLSVFDFKLQPEDVKLMDGFNKSERMVRFSDCRQHQYYPFAIEF